MPKIVTKYLSSVVAIMKDGSCTTYQTMYDAAKAVGTYVAGIHLCCQHNLRESCLKGTRWTSSDHEHKGIRYYHEDDRAHWEAKVKKTATY